MNLLNPAFHEVRKTCRNPWVHNWLQKEVSSWTATSVSRGETNSYAALMVNGGHVYSVGENSFAESVEAISSIKFKNM